MKSQPTNTIDDTLLAVAERQAEGWRVLLVRRGDRPTILNAREFSANDQTGLAAWLDSQRCGDLRVILPAAATIVRTQSMPAAAPLQMLAALRLQAEGVFLGSVPMARIGLGILDGKSDTERQGVIMAWPETQVGVEVGAKLETITRYVPEPAAMLLLAANGHPAVAADRADGSIAIALQGAEGLVIRATRESPADAADGGAAWREGLRQALVETALNAGMEPSRIAAFLAQADSSSEESGTRVVMLDANVADLLGSKLTVQVAGAEDDASWWRSWAIPLAATLICCGNLSELARLRRREQRNAPTRIEQFAERYSSPSRALRVAVAAFVIAGIAPIAAAWLRGKVLEWKMPESAGKFEVSQKEIEQRIQLYSELSKRTLPMAKLLGDLACCTPDGVEIESIQLSATQGISVRGVAKAQGEKSAAEIVNSMARLMDSSGVFDKTHWRWNTPDGRGIFKFDLDSLITRPTMAADFPEDRDWAVKTLAQRKYNMVDDADSADSSHDAATHANAGTDAAKGDGAAAEGNTLASAADTSTKANGATSSRSNGGSTAGGSGDGGVPARGIGRRDPATAPGTDGGDKPATASSGVGAGGGPAATAMQNTVIPDEVTDDQLKTMTKETARALLADFAKAKRRPDLDADTRKRLDVDFNRILDRLKGMQ